MQVETTVPLSKERLRLIDEVGAALSETLEPAEVLRAAARAVVPELADLAVIAVGTGGEVALEVAHADPEARDAAADTLSGALDVLRRVVMHESGNGRTYRLIARVTGTTMRSPARGHPELAHVLESLGVASLIVVALRTGGETIGALGLARTGDASGREYTAADLAAAQVLARRVAIAVETARLRTTIRHAATRHTRLEDTLRKWNQVFQVAEWGAAIVDGADQRIDIVNPAFARMHGYDKPEDLTGRLFSDLLAPAQRADSDAGMRNGQADAYESMHLRADGTLIPVLVNVTPLDAEGQRSHVVTVQEVSELKRAEERLRRAQRMEAVGRLAGGVAHEVNNMMTIILGFGDLLARAPELPDALQRDVDEIRKAASRAGKVTQQLLAFSRQQVLQPAELSINSVVEDLVPVLQLLLPANIRVETGLAPLDVIVRADRAQLEQVLINLAFNAKDAMVGGGTIRLTTESRHLDEEAGRRLIGIPIPAAQYALIAVVDTGHGMDRETLTQVFEPFFTTKPLGLGTGLGLSSVYGIVKQSGGYVWVDSTPGQGTTFTVGLPTVRPNRGNPGPVPETGRVDAAGSGTVLVVEDEDGVRELAARILTGRGYRVFEARNGVEALAAIDRLGAGVDLVLTDVVVPDLATDELERGLRKRAELPILYMSGYPREEVVQRNLIRPEDPFLQKPFTTEELVDGVGRVIRGREEVAGR